MTDQMPLVDENIKERRLLFAKLCESARIVSGLTREQLADKTRVPLNFIEAIENGQKDLDISSVYTRGFVRLLCKTWDSHEEDYLAAFQLAYPKAQTEGEKKASIEAVNKLQKSTGQQSLLSREGKTNLFSQLGRGVKSAMGRTGEKMKTTPGLEKSVSESKYRKVLPVVAGIVVVLGFTIFQDTLKTSERTKPVENSVDLTAEKPQKAALVSAEEIPDAPKETAPLQLDTEDAEKNTVSNSDVQGETNKSASNLSDSEKMSESEPNIAPDGQSLVAVTATDEVLVKITKDKESRKNIRLKAGGAMDFVFDDLLQLLIMDASRVRVSFNGTDLGSLGGSGRVRRISFSNTDTSQTSL